MYSLLKKFQAISLALLVFLSPLLIAAQTGTPTTTKKLLEYGLEPERVSGPRRTTTLMTPRTRTRVQQLLRSPQLFQKAGGIMFDEVSKPCAELARTKLRLSYNPQQLDGQRLILHVGKNAFSIDGIRDSDLQPIAMFADSIDPILINIQNPEMPILESCPMPPDGLQMVTLHPALVDTQLGWKMIRMDSIPWHFSNGERWDKKGPLPDDTIPLARSLGTALTEDRTQYFQLSSQLFKQPLRILAAMSLKDRRHYESLVNSHNKEGFDWEGAEDEFRAQPGFNATAWRKLNSRQKHILLVLSESMEDEGVSNFNDAKRPASFCTEASTIKLDGMPNLQFVAPMQPGNYVFPKSSSLMTKNLSQLRLVDEEAYDGLVTIYRLAGLFRYVKQRQTRQSWKQFIESLPPPQKKVSYVVLCPECDEDAVKEWWQCVAENFDLN